MISTVLLLALCCCGAFIPDPVLRALLVFLFGAGLGAYGFVLLNESMGKHETEAGVGGQQDRPSPVFPLTVSVPAVDAEAQARGDSSGAAAMNPREAADSKLRQIVSRWRFDVDALGAGISEIRSLEGEVEAACSTQMQALGSIHQGSEMIHANSKQANAIAENLAGNAEKASALSNQVQVKVDSLASDLEGALNQVEYLLEESKKINGILEIMNQIASSTHVLGINASIVAARAGHQGQAFDVVAREIRKLAESTGASLQDIEIIIKHIQETISQVADKTKKTSESILGEKKTLLEVAGALQGVILSVEVIRTMTSVAADTALDLQKQVDTASATASSRLDHSHFKTMESKIDSAVRNIRTFLDQVHNV